MDDTLDARTVVPEATPDDTGESYAMPEMTESAEVEASQASETAQQIALEDTPTADLPPDVATEADESSELPSVLDAFERWALATGHNPKDALLLSVFTAGWYALLLGE